MAKRSPNVWFTEQGAESLLLRPFKCVAPVWEGGVLIQDAAGQWWLRETGRHLAEDITRHIATAYAWSLYGLAFPTPEPETLSQVTASGEIEC